MTDFRVHDFYSSLFLFRLLHRLYHSFLNRTLLDSKHIIYYYTIVSCCWPASILTLFFSILSSIINPSRHLHIPQLAFKRHTLFAQYLLTMPLYFSKSIDHRNLDRILSIDRYIERLDNGSLTPTTKSFGYWTYAVKGTPPPTANSEAELFNHFRAQWNFAIVELALEHKVSLSILRKALDNVVLPPMAASLSSVPEDSTPTSASTVVSPITSPTSREQRRERLDVLNKALRPPPFTHIWEFWYDKHVADSSAGQPAYENRVKSLLQVSDIKEFYQFYNNTPISILKVRDSLHLFKKTVKPVWEDPRNLKGGAWTFRVNKDKSTSFWEEIMLLAVGETLQDAVIGQRGQKPVMVCSSDD